jgi:TM2 domain-containing membrane protein YozV
MSDQESTVPSEPTEPVAAEAAAPAPEAPEAPAAEAAPVADAPAPAAPVSDAPVPPPPPPAYGQATPAYPNAGAPVESKKIVCGILAILLGAFGIHKFILGYKTEGLIMLLVTVLSCFLLSPIMSIIGIIEGIIYLTKSDQEFIETYQVGHKGWF